VLKENRLVIVSDCYEVVSSARTKIESEMSEVMLCEIYGKLNNKRGAVQVGWVQHGNSEHGYEACERNPIPKERRIRICKQIGGVGFEIQLDQE